MDGHKASLYANTIPENIFLQVDEEVNRLVLFDEIVYHRVDGTDTMKQDDFIISNNVGKRQRETTINMGNSYSVEIWISGM